MRQKEVEGTRSGPLTGTATAAARATACHGAGIMGASRVPPKTLPMLLRPALSCLLLAAASLAPASSHAEPSTTGAGAAALVS